jgi:hypothetical protein
MEVEKITENEAAIEELSDFAIGINQEVSNITLGLAIKALEENQQYRTIGTVEEFQALKNRFNGYKVSIMDYEGAEYKKLVEGSSATGQTPYIDVIKIKEKRK